MRIAAPNRARIGEVVEIRTLVAHPMESGFRLDHRGQAIPRDIIKHFRVLLNDKQVFYAEFFPAVSANPYLSFHLRLTRGGELRFSWEDQHGNVSEAQHTIEVA